MMVLALHRAWAFVRRDAQIQASYRLDFVMRIGGIVLSVAVFYFISDMLGTVVNPYLQDYRADYFHFALMGVAFYPLIDASIASLSRIIQEYQSDGTLEVLFLSPMPILLSLLLSNLWTYLWTLAQSLLYLLSGVLLFGATLNWSNLLNALLVIAMAVLANAGLGLINASFVLVTKRSSPIAALLSLVTGLLAGVYYPVEVLPGWLRSLSLLLPATHALNALRTSLLGGATWQAILPELIVMALFAILLLPLGLFSFRLAVRWAKIDGSLTQY
jgi:ABC-2 type transport system permease protein